MPTPDGRSWLTSDQIATQLGQAMINDPRIPEQMRTYLLAHKAVAKDVLKDAFVATEIGLEFKVARLCEKLRDAIDAGNITTFDEVRDSIKEIYTLSFLDQFDEEGELLP